MKIAVVGAGYMAREHIRAFSGLPGVQIAGVFSRTEARARALAQEFAIPHVCSSIDELYARTRAELVVVAVTELSMNAAAKACFLHPWLCLLEKPAGYDLADAEDIMAAAQSNRARAYVALNRRAYGSTRRALEIATASAGGRRMIEIHDQQDIGAARAAGQPEQVARNYMYANSIHLIDYLRVFGRGAVSGVEPVLAWDPRQPGFVIAHIRFASGDIGVYTGTWDGPGPWAVAVSDSQVRLEMRPLESLVVQRRGERTRTTLDAEPLDAQFKPGLRIQAQRAIVLAGGGTGDGLATLADATESMRLCARIFGLQ